MTLNKNTRILPLSHKKLPGTPGSESLESPQSQPATESRISFKFTFTLVVRHKNTTKSAFFLTTPEYFLVASHFPTNPLEKHN